jgi:hypothetical protein
MYKRRGHADYVGRRVTWSALSILPFSTCRRISSNAPFARLEILTAESPLRKRNRAQPRDAYESAVCDMVDRTSTATTSWTLVEVNNKYYARIKVLRVLCEAVEDALERISKKGKKNKKI